MVEAVGLMLPFVSRLAYQQVCEERDRLLEQVRGLAERHDTTLRDALDLVRESRQAPTYAEPPVSPLAALGPRTTAALADMAQGMPPANRRAMEAKALALWAEHAKADDRDSTVAAAVRRGEPVGR
jgi:hypothetical protein